MEILLHILRNIALTKKILLIILKAVMKFYIYQ